MVLKISISGPAGAGKDELRKALQRRMRVAHLSFAQPMKQMVSIATGLTVDEVELVKEGKTTPEIEAKLKGTPLATETPEQRARRMRNILIEVGDPVMRQMWHQDVWVDNFARRAEEVVLVDAVVGTDTRYENEFEGLERNGFIMVDVLAPKSYLRIPPGHEKWNAPSERRLDGYRTPDVVPEWMPATGTVDRFHHRFWNNWKETGRTMDQIADELLKAIAQGRTVKERPTPEREATPAPAKA